MNKELPLQAMIDYLEQHPEIEEYNMRDSDT